MAELPEFSWSAARDALFRECLRKYYFHYYGAWGGWAPAAPPRARELYVLKRLQTRGAWADAHVHRAIRAALRGDGPAPAAEEATRRLLDDLRRDFRDSQQRRYRQDPQHACGLFEHEYELNLPDTQWKQTADQAVHDLGAFLASELFRHLRDLTADAQLDLAEPAACTLAGLKVYAQIDSAERSGSGLLLYDWQTGARPDTPRALPRAAALLYAVTRWRATPEQVNLVEFNLASGQTTPHRFDTGALEEMKETVADSADEMSFLLEDPATNQPQPEAAFDLAEDEAVCRRCNFLKACPRWA